MSKYVYYLLAVAVLCDFSRGQEERCLQPIDPSHCEAYIERYAYDVDKGKCVMFIWGGCEGNSNRFETMEQCQETCEC